ncbi:MAG: GspE/PulE family protein [bacterium]|nr:GspE/PulE family protein [bacterium]
MPSSNLQGALDKKLTELEAAGVEEQAKEVATKAGLPYLKINPNSVDLEALRILPEKDSHAAQVAVIAQEKKQLRVIIVDPLFPLTQKVLKDLAEQGFTIEQNIVSASSLKLVWERYQDIPKNAIDSLGTVAIDEDTFTRAQKEIKSVAALKEKLSFLSTTKMLEVLLAGAITLEASDIHLEPEEATVRTRYRLDGVLNNVAEVSPENYAKLLSRIKITSGLKLNIHNAPQDGRFSVRHLNKMIEIRVSVLPGSYGENIVMRILDPDNIMEKIEDLGLSEKNMAALKKLLQKSTGALLTTGPTGSGKTTSLYAFVQHINEPGSKIITIEDPVEYHLTGISQTQVNPAKGYTFASGLRSIVRQDPDVILVGEIRDGETAEIAMQAALTGHLVFSTLHTNDAAGAIPRLLDLGAKPASIAPALNAVIAQRLLRKLCEKCRQKKTIPDEELEEMKKALAGLESAPEVNTKTEIFFPSQCEACNMTGYKGRLGVFEFFIVDDDIEKIILTSPAVSEMKELAMKKGMVTLIQDGYLKVLEGKTSLEEVRRILE